MPNPVLPPEEPKATSSSDDGCGGAFAFLLIGLAIVVAILENFGTIIASILALFGIVIVGYIIYIVIAEFFE